MVSGLVEAQVDDGPDPADGQDDQVAQSQPKAGLFKDGFAHTKTDQDFADGLIELERPGPVAGIISQPSQQGWQPGPKQQRRQPEHNQQLLESSFGRPAPLPQYQAGVQPMDQQQPGGKIVGVQGHRRSEGVKEGEMGGWLVNWRAGG